jgi:hypothetical protein
MDDTGTGKTCGNENGKKLGESNGGGGLQDVQIL